MAHIGPEPGRKYAPCGDRNRCGGLMILICPVAGVPGSAARIPGDRTIYRSCQLSLAWREFGGQLTTPLTAGAGDTTAATSGAGTSRFASGTSGRASGELPPRACRTGAPPACSRGRSGPALVRRTPVSSSDPRPFRTALTATGDTGRASVGFKREPQYCGRPGKRSGRAPAAAPPRPARPAAPRPPSGPPGQRPARPYDVDAAFMQLLRHERGNHAVWPLYGWCWRG